MPPMPIKIPGVGSSPYQRNVLDSMHVHSESPFNKPEIVACSILLTWTGSKTQVLAIPQQRLAQGPVVFQAQARKWGIAPRYEPAPALVEVTSFKSKPPMMDQDIFGEKDGECLFCTIIGLVPIELKNDWGDKQNGDTKSPSHLLLCFSHSISFSLGL